MIIIEQCADTNLPLITMGLHCVIHFLMNIGCVSQLQKGINISDILFEVITTNVVREKASHFFH